MGKDDLLTERQVAEILGLAPATLMKNRSLGRCHPPFVKIGGRVLYPRKEFEAWVKALPRKQEIKAG